jgi:hypothetical protein
VQTEGVRHIAIHDKRGETLGRAIIGDIVELRLTAAEDRTVRFAFRLPGEEFAPVGEPTAFHFDFWTGARPGLFTFSDIGGPPGGLIDIDWVRVDKAQRP